jgi:glycosyltransferase involved in cell wall biosynthesis
MLCYIAYPTSQTLQSANALQTYATIRELRARRPDTLVLIPRMQRGPSRFEEVGAVHLPRPAIGRLSRFYRSTLWYYLEYSAFAAMCVPFVAAHRHQIEAIYVRQSICAAWWSAVFAPRLGNIPVIYEAHDLESRNPSRAREAWAQSLLHLLDRTALTRSTAVSSLTADFRRYLAAIDWRAPDDVFVVPDAYDEQLFVPQDRAASRAALGIAPDAHLLVYTGMTFSYRWLDGLLAAVARLVETHPRLLLLLVGGRPAEILALNAQVTALGIRKHVRLVGSYPQAEVVHYLSAADVLAIPDTVTDMTASPLKLFEYLALGQPLVLPDLPALREIVPPELAHYFPRRSLDGLTSALARAIAAGDDAAGVAARRALAAEHTYGRRAERILSLVEQVAGRATAG